MQIGEQSYRLATCIMTESALAFFRSSQGRQFGTGPTVAALDQGLAASLTSTTMSQDVYALCCAQRGLMAALAPEGAKITRIAVEVAAPFADTGASCNDLARAATFNQL